MVGPRLLAIVSVSMKAAVDDRGEGLDLGPAIVAFITLPRPNQPVRGAAALRARRECLGVWAPRLEGPIRPALAAGHESA